MQKYTAAAFLVVLLGACGEPPAQNGSPSAPMPAFVDTIWATADAGASPGTFRIFLSDGTLVMDSCGETYRLARWKSIGDRRIEWTEDTARIEADITQLTNDEFHLRLHLVNEVKDETYRRARAPFVCPDMPC